MLHVKLHSPTARAILRTFKTSRVTINHVMHEQVHTISCAYSIIYSTCMLQSGYAANRTQRIFKKIRASIGTKV